MNRPTHKQAMWAGLSILFLVNAAALGGAAWNRSAKDSQLRLSQRELAVPYAYEVDAEDSGSWLALDWRTAPKKRAEDEPELPDYFYAASRQPRWLGPDKLRELGFDLTTPPAEGPLRRWRSAERTAVLVLELDGPAYASRLSEAKEDAARARAAAAADPASKPLREKASQAAKNLREELEERSRLFAVEVGLDQARLRARYPDRSRYALVPALIQVRWERDRSSRWYAQGSIQHLLHAQIHLPRAQAQILERRITDTRRIGRTVGHFGVDLVIGRRLDPWVASAWSD